MKRAAAPADEAALPRRGPGRPKLSQPTPEHRQRLTEIIDTATMIFHERGYDNGSLDDVAAAVGLTKGSLYHYLSSKKQLLYLIFDRALTRGLGRLDALGEIDDARQRLASLIAHQVCMVVEDPMLFAVFFDSRPRLDDEYAEIVVRREHEYVARFRDLVGQALPGATPAESRYTTHALIGMTNWTYKWFDRDRDDFRAVVRGMIALIIGEGVDVDAALASAINHAAAASLPGRGRRRRVTAPVH